MRRKIFLFAVMLLSVLTMRASDASDSSSDRSSSWRFGIKGGLNVATLGNLSHPSISEDFSSFVGFSAGVVTSFSLPVQGMTLQPELYYLSNGFKVSSDNFSIGYLHLPINLQVGLDLILLRPFLMVSPYISYALYNSSDNSWTSLNRFDYGIGVGGGIDFWRMQLQVKYNWSFARSVEFPMVYDEVSLTSGGGTGGDFYGSNRNLEVSLVFFF